MRRQAGGSVGGELVEAGFGGSWIRGSGGGGDLHHGAREPDLAEPISRPGVGFFFFFFVYFHQLTTADISRPPRLISHLPWPLDRGGRLCPPRKT